VAFDRKRFWLPAAEGAPLLGYEKLDAFYRDVREGNLAPHYYERRGKRIFVSALALGLIPSSGGADREEAQEQGQSLATATYSRA
jgi:hypothetical protein